jgi:hypothetical protein
MRVASLTQTKSAAPFDQAACTYYNTYLTPAGCFSHLARQEPLASTGGFLYAFIIPHLPPAFNSFSPFVASLPGIPLRAEPASVPSRLAAPASASVTYDQLHPDFRTLLGI